MKRILTVVASATLLACGAGDTDIFTEGDIDSIVFLQRPTRTDVGNVFQYSSYVPGARIVKLSPPSADGTLEVICCDHPEMAEADISWFDLDFDADEIVMSAKLAGGERYGLFLLDLTNNELEQIPTNPNRDYVFPIFLPNDRIMFSTTESAEEGFPQHRDEYNRGVSIQLGTIGRDGSDLQLAGRNLSHRVTPTLLSDGRVMFTQWEHLGNANDGILMIANPDLTVVREAFGKEGSAVSNSALKATEVAPGRVVAVATSRQRTIQAGALVDIRLGETYPCNAPSAADDVGAGGLCADRNMSEANSSFRILTPLVPRDRVPSETTVGRYSDARALTSGENPILLVSWSDGPVHSDTNAAAGIDPDFGIYLYDSSNNARKPIYNDPAYWDIYARPLEPRDPPPVIQPSAANEFDDKAVLIGSMNVYESSVQEFAPGSIYGVRILEGFSVEEIRSRNFGLTKHEGSALLGVAPVYPDGSWAALIPAHAAVHLQAVDVFAMSLRSEPVWISGNPGESMFCGGCHEDRAATTIVQPGITQAVAAQPADMVVPRAERLSYDYTRDGIVGVPWGDAGDPGALQAIFDAKCVSCHDGDPAKPGNPSITITDTETGQTQTFTFDLRGTPAQIGFGDAILSAYTASHLSLLGPGELQQQIENEELPLEITGDLTAYVIPNEARNSALIQKLNPPQLYPTYDPSVRAFDAPVHPVDVGGQALTEDEYFAIILMVDSGGQFVSRENADVEY